MRRIQPVSGGSGRRGEVGVPGLHGDDETAEIGTAGWPSTAGDVLDPTGHILGTGLGRWCRPRPRFWTWGPVGLPRHVSMRALAVDVFDVDGRADQMGRPRYIDERFPTLRALEHGRKGCGGRRKPSSDPLGRPARDAAQSSGVTSRGECVRDTGFRSSQPRGSLRNSAPASSYGLEKTRTSSIDAAKGLLAA